MIKDVHYLGCQAARGVLGPVVRNGRFPVEVGIGGHEPTCRYLSVCAVLDSSSKTAQGLTRKWAWHPWRCLLQVQCNRSLRYYKQLEVTMAPPDEPYGGLNARDYNEVVSALGEWAESNPRSNEPIFFEMGRSYTPLQFVIEVRERTDIGTSFLEYIAFQSRRTETRPRTFVDRAILANRGE